MLVACCHYFCVEFIEIIRPDFKYKAYKSSMCSPVVPDVSVFNPFCSLDVQLYSVPVRE